MGRSEEQSVPKVSSGFGQGGLAVVVATVCVASFLLFAPASVAQAPRLSDVQIEGDHAPFTKEQLFLQIRTEHNRRFLGLSGVSPGLWVYQLAGDGEGGLARALRRAGEAPATFDQATADDDAERIVALLRQEGFLGATVEVTVDTLEAPTEESAGRVSVSFAVNRGPPTYIRSIRYDGLDGLVDDELRAIADETTLSLQTVSPYILNFTGREQRFAERELLAERAAIIDYLRTIGFARVSRDSIQAVVFGLPEGAFVESPPDSVDVVFNVNTGERYVFGDVDVTVSGPDEFATEWSDERSVGDGELRTYAVGDGGLSAGLMERALGFVPGEQYDTGGLLTTKQRLERTGVFAFTDITPGAVDTTETGQLRLSHRLTLRTRQRHSIRVEGFVLERTGVLGVDNNEVAFGAGATYRNGNLFGGGESFSLRTTGSVAGDISDGFPTAQAEISASLALSSLVPPFGFLETVLDPLDTRTQISLGFLTARQEALGVIIRGRASLGVRLEANHTSTRSSALDLLDISLSDPDTLDGFSANFLSFVEDPVARQFVLEDYTKPQINTALRYTFRSITANPFRRDQGSALEISAEVGGNAAALLDRFVFTPDTTEGSLPGLPFFGGDGSSRLEYRPYIRGLVDVRHYFSSPRGVLALKLFAGAAHPTGSSPVVPFDRRFFAGGASSIRGWNFRTLGPGSLSGDGVFVQGGDIKLEFSTEARLILIRNLFTADWQLAAFADAGNVWFGSRNPGDDAGRFELDQFYNEVAIGGGYGLRIAWEYLILRFDLGYKVHSPVPGEGWFPEGIGSPILHFGIGQAF